MAHEKLIIKNFIGIKDLELEINRFNVFIGPQASGKSVIVKLIHFFRSVFQEMENFLLTDHGLIKDFSEKLEQKFYTYFPDKCLSDKEFTIEYFFSKDNHITLYGDGMLGSIRFNFPEIFIHFYEDAYDKSSEALFTNSLKDIPPITLKRSEFARYLRESSLWWSEPFFIPAGRTFFSIFQDSLFSFLNYSPSPALDPFFINFGNYYEIFRKKAEILDLEGDPVVSKLVKDLLQGKYEFRSGRGYLKFDDREVDLQHSSSGQQEVLPLILTLLGTKSYPLFSLIIEEPEAHLFPETQKSITELVVSIFNSSENRGDIFITTHSPYVLTVLNTLLYAGQIAGKLKDKTKLDRIVPQMLQMNFKDVSVWALDSKGSCKLIMNKETGLIDAEIIDEVSNNISEEFCKLVDLDE